MSPTITLYHTTNLASALKMKELGIGLDLDDYRNFISLLCKQFQVDVKEMESLLDEFLLDTEANGGVSFFQNQKACEAISHYGRFGGEWREQITKKALKRIARIKKIPYHTIKSSGTDFLGINSSPAIVKVELPLDYVANPHQISQGGEVYTVKKVPSCFIVDIINL